MGFGFADSFAGGGSVYVWGSGKYGQLGNNDTADLPLPDIVKGIPKKVIAGLSLGPTHMVAVTSGGGEVGAVRADGMRVDGGFCVGEQLGRAAWAHLPQRQVEAEEEAAVKAREARLDRQRRLRRSGGATHACDRYARLEGGGGV
jgi:hypothetical protein